ncbi:MAG: tryptophan synthase subunit alpha [Gammaproteobacteria bacterium]|nr:tryptophan synthase subunit alpha [Gammaproteobacteria bacterium]
MGTNLKQAIQDQLKSKTILIMSHTVIGYPSLAISAELVDELVVNGRVDLIELQFPFSEPIADGPILLKANQTAVRDGTSIETCFDFARTITARHSETIFVIMTYYNILFKHGVMEFVKEAAEANIKGIITPDIPPEVAQDYIEACKKYQVSPIFLVTPDTTPERIRFIASLSEGMVYCVARPGVTGQKTTFTPEFYAYIDRVKANTDLPIGVGFGLRTKEDIDQLSGKAEIAIMCSKAIELCVNESPAAVGGFFGSLRSA